MDDELARARSARSAPSMLTSSLRSSTFGKVNLREELRQVFSERGGIVSVAGTEAVNKQLMRASDRGLMDEARHLIESLGADPTAQDEEGWTALHYATINGYRDVTKYLLKNGAQADTYTKTGWTALHKAAEMQLKPIAKSLLKRGAAPSLPEEAAGWTPLHFAASRNHVELCELLVKYKADVNAQAKDGRTAFHLAAEEGNLALLQVLLQSGAGYDSQDFKTRTTALHRACYKGHTSIVSLLLGHGADQTLQDKDGDTALHWAAIEGHLEVVQLLLERGTDLNLQDKAGYTALHCAAMEGHYYVAAVLLDNGVNVELQDKDGCTALHLASIGGHQDVILVLMRHEMDMNIRDNDDQTALHCAVHHGHQQLALVLMGVVHPTNAVQIDLQDKDGRTPLHLAAFNDALVVAAALLVRGADMSIEDKDGDTAFDIALKMNADDIVQALIKYAPGPALTMRDGRRRTLLMRTAEADMFRSVMLLISRGVDPLAQDENGLTAEDWAVSNGIKHLLKKEAQNAMNKGDGVQSALEEQSSAARALDVELTRAVLPTSFEHEEIGSPDTRHSTPGSKSSGRRPHPLEVPKDSTAFPNPEDQAPITPENHMTSSRASSSGRKQAQGAASLPTTVTIASADLESLQKKISELEQKLSDSQVDRTRSPGSFFSKCFGK